MRSSQSTSCAGPKGLRPKRLHNTRSRSPCPVTLLKFCSISNARAWLFEVARNALADRLKVRREMVELPDDLASEECDRDAVDQLSACLPRVLSELSPTDREAIDL